MASTPAEGSVSAEARPQFAEIPRLISVKVFEQLRHKIDPAELERQEQLVNEKIHAQFERTQQRQADLVSYTCVRNPMKRC